MQTRPRPVKYRRKNKLRFEHKPGKPNLELRAYQVVLRPLVTEKGTHQSTRYNTYAFMVNPLATKTQIQHAVEELFGVRVEAVRTQNRMGKKTRFRNVEGERSTWKRALVSLHEEDRIEFF